MVYFYLIAAGALLPILNNFFTIFDKGYSWWLAPLLYIAFFLCFIILHIGLLVLGDVRKRCISSSSKLTLQ